MPTNLELKIIKNYMENEFNKLKKDIDYIKKMLDYIARWK